MVEVKVTNAVLGSRRSYSIRELGVAVVLLATVLLASFATHFIDAVTVVDRHLFFLAVLVAVITAIVSAYRNSGIVLCWLLLYAPLLAQLLFTSWLVQQWDTVPAPMIGVFYSAPGWQFWTFTAFLLGTLCFGVGVTVRRGQTAVFAES